VFASEKQVIVNYWLKYEGLDSVLGDKQQDFIDWFNTSTSPETITRCLRALKEDGTIKLSPGKQKQRQKKERQYREYWRHHRNNRLGGCD
jgi:hypothetical protein